MKKKAADFTSHATSVTSYAKLGVMSVVANYGWYSFADLKYFWQKMASLESFLHLAFYPANQRRKATLFQLHKKV